VAALKKRFSELGVMTDVALDPYTSHGRMVVIDDRATSQRQTLDILKQALVQAPPASTSSASDMMDGRIGRIRAALEKAGHIHTLIMPTRRNTASGFYGPFRDAVRSAKFLARATETYRWTREFRRGAMGSRPRSRRGRRHGDGQNRACRTSTSCVA